MHTEQPTTSLLASITTPPQQRAAILLCVGLIRTRAFLLSGQFDVIQCRRRRCILKMFDSCWILGVLACMHQFGPFPPRLGTSAFMSLMPFACTAVQSLSPGSPAMACGGCAAAVPSGSEAYAKLYPEKSSDSVLRLGNIVPGEQVLTHLAARPMHTPPLCSSGGVDARRTRQQQQQQPTQLCGHYAACRCSVHRSTRPHLEACTRLPTIGVPERSTNTAAQQHFETLLHAHNAKDGH